MIRFFRQIRQHLITENPPDPTSRAGRFSKYLLYAVGEILLVVIGILIALQINTWNEQRLTKQRELKFLTELNYNLKRNLTQFDNFLAVENRLIENMSKLVAYHQSGLEYHDSLDVYYMGISWLEQINLVTSAYETMKTNGLDIISSDSLSLNIIDLHEVQYAHHVDLVEDVGLGLFNTRVQPIKRKYHGLAESFENREFIEYLEDRISWKKDLVSFSSLLRVETESLIGEINAELERLP